MEIRENHPIKAYNTFGLDVRAAKFAEVASVDELRELLQAGSGVSRKVFFLGGGSNVLFVGDFSGMIVKISMKGISVVGEDQHVVHLRAEAGEDWDQLVEYCTSRGWGGLENLSGIPGQVGSAPIQNIGAYGTELCDHFVSLEALNTCTGELVNYTPEQCRFGYRDSIFKRALKGRVVITAVVFRLEKKPVINLAYQTLNDRLSGLSGDALTIARVREAVLSIRASRLPDPAVVGNAGSFFKNPVVDDDRLDDLKRDFPGLIHFGRKLAAGWLIDACGWKGYREGDAGVHKDQALVLVNYGQATGSQIMVLADKIRESVSDKFGVDLEREVNVIY